ncbi:hypothetical protein HCN44_010340 [Aphidius gifuensis]|uniref:Ribosomal RNA-processing protein 43 n=1 Tax=Aphidius gifuensis TaxID=684658 RepID=A0A834XWZ7_APHGI|nr:exosome complex component RRP43-like [Aphidius gifuensis]KAF7993745.1 hypothetical protein HCN44_010340 [Aphidius gifuensis]
MASLYKTIYPVKYLRDYLSENIRPDGREFLSFRPVSVNVSSVTQADSSAIFKLGNTTVVCGIKAELCCPKSDAPDCGSFIPNVGLTALCSSKYRPGPPSDQAQAMSKMIDDILTNSGIVDLKDLCISKDKLSWALYCDLECIDADGSVFDACVGALMAALSTLTLPEIVFNPDSKTTLVHPTNRISLPIRGILGSATFAIFNDNLLIADPSDEEETLALARFSIVMSENELCCVHKPGGVTIAPDVLQKTLIKARNRIDKIRTLIKTAISKT